MYRPERGFLKPKMSCERGTIQPALTLLMVLRVLSLRDNSLMQCGHGN